jgi:hypothetical protein
MRIPDSYEGQNWLVFPIGASVAGKPQSFYFQFSGVVNFVLPGRSGGFNFESLQLTFDDSVRDAKMRAASMSGISLLPEAEFNIVADMWVPYANVAEYFNENRANDSGFTAQRWRPMPFGLSWDAQTQTPLGNLWRGIIVDLGSADSDGTVRRVSYHASIVGRLVQTKDPCKRQVERFQSAKNKVSAIEGEIRTLQDELSSAPPSWKAGIIEEIRIARLELAQANRELDSATQALNECRGALGGTGVMSE